jgi:RNA polymerase-interacting CarD/CdnL/TRCF family regulator
VDFHVGDKVIHSSHGLADIVDLENREISGSVTRYYVVRTKDLTIWIPVNQSENGSLRMPASRSEFERLFPILRARYDPFSENRMERKTQIHSRIKAGNSGSLCRLVRDLSYYNKTKKLNDTEGTILDRAVTWLVDEWQYAMSVTPTEAKKELNQLLDESYRVSTA